MQNVTIKINDAMVQAANYRYQRKNGNQKKKTPIFVILSNKNLLTLALRMRKKFRRYRKPTRIPHTPGNIDLFHDDKRSYII